MNYPFELKPLPYTSDELEAVIDKQTVEIHHGKHQQTYVDNLNKLVAEKNGYENTSLEELMDVDETPIRNNAGGVWNHMFYWEQLIGTGKSQMSEKMKSRLEKSFGSVEKFMEDMEKCALGRFGSGWAWLVTSGEDGLEILSTANQDNPMVLEKKPVFCIDVWEHAYYLKYQNRRAEYVKNFWQIVNWEVVEKRVG